MFATEDGTAEAAYRMVEEAAGADAEGVDESTFVMNNRLGEVYRTAARCSALSQAHGTSSPTESTTNSP